MRFSTLIAFILPFSAALAAPSVVRRRDVNLESLENIKEGIKRANEALGLILDFTTDSNIGHSSPNLETGARTALESLVLVSEVGTIEETLRNQQAPPVADIRAVSNGFITAMFIANRFDIGEVRDKNNGPVVRFAIRIESTRQNFNEARDGLTLAIKSLSDLLINNFVR